MIFSAWRIITFAHKNFVLIVIIFMSSGECAKQPKMRPDATSAKNSVATHSIAPKLSELTFVFVDETDNFESLNNSGLCRRRSNAIRTVATQQIKRFVALLKRTLLLNASLVFRCSCVIYIELKFGCLAGAESSGSTIRQQLILNDKLQNEKFTPRTTCNSHSTTASSDRVR